MQKTQIDDNIVGERTEAAVESAAERAENFTEATPEMVSEGEGNASENAFHSVSEFIEGISETQEEDGTDHTIRSEQEVKEGDYEFNTGEETTMEAVNQIPKSELEVRDSERSEKLRINALSCNHRWMTCKSRQRRCWSKRTSNASR